MYISSLQILLDCVIFFVANNIENFTCMLVGYTINYVENLLSHSFEIINIIFNFLNNESTSAQEPKVLSDIIATQKISIPLCSSRNSTQFFKPPHNIF
jgi:hypothetical protein